MAKKKRKKGMSIPLLAILGLLVVAGVAKMVSSSGGTDDGGAGSLTVSERSWDLGTVSMKDGIDLKEVSLTNTSGVPVTVTAMETSCMCTTVTIVHEDGTRSASKGMRGHGGTPYLSETIVIGETATLEIAFDPNAHGPNGVGPIRRSVTLQTDSVDEGTVKLDFSGIVTK